LYYDILCVAGFFRRSDRRTTYIRAGVIRAFCEDTLYLARPRERFYTIMVRPSYGVAVASCPFTLWHFELASRTCLPATCNGHTTEARTFSLFPLSPDRNASPPNKCQNNNWPVRFRFTKDRNASRIIALDWLMHINHRIVSSFAVKIVYSLACA
jgi:hypothetical protein